MRVTEYINSFGCPKGAFIYHFKRNGERYKNPSFHPFYGLEKNADDVIKRLEKLNPGKRFEKADTSC